MYIHIIPLLSVALKGSSSITKGDATSLALSGSPSRVLPGYPSFQIFPKIPQIHNILQFSIFISFICLFSQRIPNLNCPLNLDFKGSFEFRCLNVLECSVLKDPLKLDVYVSFKFRLSSFLYVFDFKMSFNFRILKCNLTFGSKVHLKCGCLNL